MSSPSGKELEELARSFFRGIKSWKIENMVLPSSPPLGLAQAERDLRQTSRVADAVVAQLKERKHPGSAQADVAAWLLAKATETNGKLTREAYRRQCMKETGATWRQYDAAFQDLPAEHRYKRGQS
jgi:hypothetical protein